MSLPEFSYVLFEIHQVFVKILLLITRKAEFCLAASALEIKVCLYGIL